MRYIVASMLVCACCISLQAQNLESTIKIQAMDMAKALMKKDFVAFSRYMHPKMVAAAGGRDKMLVRMDTMNKMATQFGAEIKKITIGHPGKIISYKNELQSTLPQTTEMKFMLGKVILETTLIAISQDKGAHWYFIDTSVYHAKEIKNALPDLSPDIVIPPLKQPQIIPDQAN